MRLVFCHKLIPELVTGSGMHHIIYEQFMNNEVRTLALHEKVFSLLMAGYPFRSIHSEM
jgi:hypothetical protein